ncbi:hypothetical protein CC86DRAFT_400454 [Ophiobolus disseminans]|uniref:Uncharacterized protein n=1 Tax=Ophiobolus disseminans TaxID=1469910 RepID=A0A6A7ALL2_9PLEO|nr:hypothetical protein CC86DRAFT_400454 [Ophiobolus disseminans]
MDKTIVYPQIVAEFFECILHNSYDITIGPFEQIPKFLTDDFFGVGIKVEDYSLRRLTTVIKTPKYTPPGVKDFDVALTPLLARKFREGFTLDVRIHHTKETTLGASHLISLLPFLKQTMNRLRGYGIRCYIAFKHVNLESWIIDPLVSQDRGLY